jgi:cell fate regulator YaaT (PSP1 superfamily)
MNDYKTNGCNNLCCKGFSRIDSQLHVFDWLCDVPGNLQATDFVEVQFKNTRKGYYLNSNHLPLEKGDVVAVEASPGHDVGTVTLTGSLVLLQMKKANLKDDAPVRRIYRKARPVDMEKYDEAKAREHNTMIEARQIAKNLGLQMKIGDVEYQGDGGKAIFYYIADGRVDFRQLIKVLAEAFRVRIEMKQIGARQEAGRIGGFGPCGRELCCSTWMSSFNSVSTGAARCQDLAMNPQKLAGQCAKLKCCMNYEVDAYAEALRQFPARDITLETTDGKWHFFKSDILARQITYSSDKNLAANLVTISTRRAFEILRMNNEGQKPENLSEDGTPVDNRPNDLLDQDSLTRFDRSRKPRKKSSRRQGNQEKRQSNQEKRESKPEKRQGNQDKREKREGDNRNNRNRRDYRGGRNRGSRPNDNNKDNKNEG